jgi:NAD(P)H-flavin reductase
MHNPYQSQPAKIIDISAQTDNIKLFRFEFEKKILASNFNFKPGQFVELSIPGFGESPFAPCSAPGTKYLELCIRNTGKLTEKLHALKIGDKVGIRGPYGQGWPVQVQSSKFKVQSSDKKNLLIVVGGLGLIPLRTLILGKDKFLGKDAKIQIFYGTRLPQEMLFRYEYNRWRAKGVKINLTVDKKCPDWVGCVGLVPTLLDQSPLIENAKVFLCGPPVMYKSVLEKLKEKGVADRDIFLSLERRMHCGLGVCQHCGVGSYYTCKDGPVFAYEQIKNIPGAI